MTAAELRTLETLCARCEALQAKLAQRKNRHENRIHEHVAKAKDSLLDAIREAEEVRS